MLMGQSESQYHTCPPACHHTPHDDNKPSESVALVVVSPHSNKTMTKTGGDWLEDKENQQ